MASKRQSDAARRNVKKAQKAAGQQRTIAHLPAETRHELGKQGARGRARGGQAGPGLDDRSRRQLYELARAKGVRGRSRMGRAELIEALRKAA